MRLWETDGVWDTYRRDGERWYEREESGSEDFFGGTCRMGGVGGDGLEGLDAAGAGDTV